MPNWCSNGVTISHEDPAKIAALAEAMRDGNFLNHIIPVPQELTDTVAGSFGDDERQALLEAQTKSNIEKYGYGNWYDFCVARWGTKWDVSCDGGVDVSDDGLTINASFESAWAPPCHVYEAMVEDEYSVTAYYYEPGMGYVGKWEDGIDDCYEYGGETSKTVRDVIGDELDDYFGISESMADYEDENEIDELEEFLEQGAEVKGLNKPEPLKFD
jgi:hypothetical protein